MKPSITGQRAAVETLLDPSVVPGPETVRAARAAVETLRWIERHPDLARAVALLMREFPGAEIARPT